MSITREVLYSTYKTEISAVVSKNGFITLRDDGKTISELALIPAAEAKRVIEILEAAIAEALEVRGEA